MNDNELFTNLTAEFKNQSICDIILLEDTTRSHSTESGKPIVWLNGRFSINGKIFNSSFNLTIKGLG
jgi:hypothetical protein